MNHMKSRDSNLCSRPRLHPCQLHYCSWCSLWAVGWGVRRSPSMGTCPPAPPSRWWGITKQNLLLKGQCHEIFCVNILFHVLSPHMYCWFRINNFVFEINLQNKRLRYITQRRVETNCGKPPRSVTLRGSRTPRRLTTRTRTRPRITVCGVELRVV